MCDGERAVALPAARDHKRLGDGDTGPNTGGMGAYSPLPDLTDADVDGILADVHRPILAELARRGTPFRGFLYAGLMLTADGPVLLECNARLGDPETQVMLPAARWRARSGPAGRRARRARRRDHPGASAGAPGRRGRGRARRRAPTRPDRVAATPITGIEEARRLGALVFHAGTARDRRRLDDERRPDPDGRRSRRGPRGRARRRRARRRRHHLRRPPAPARHRRGAAAEVLAR